MVLRHEVAVLLRQVAPEAGLAWHRRLVMKKSAYPGTPGCPSAGRVRLRGAASSAGPARPAAIAALGLGPGIPDRIFATLIQHALLGARIRRLPVPCAHVRRVSR